MILSIVVLIVNVGQINWLSCQVFGISKQDLKMGIFRVPDENFAQKCHFWTTSRLENGLVQYLLRLKNLCRTKSIVTFDGFHGSESLSIDFMI